MMQPAVSRQGLGHRLYAILSMLIGLAVALVLVEVLVRIFFDEPVQPRFVMDGGYGVRANQPHVQTRHYVPGEYDVRITTNSAGMRGQREYTLEKPAGVRRILILGDSFSHGYGVEDAEVVSVLLEDMLNQRAQGRKYEVINLSVSGFGQAEELITYRARGRQYVPDIVILFFFENDIGNNAISRLFELTPQGTVRPSGRAFLPGVRTREVLYAIAPTRWLFEHSEAWNLIRNRLSALVQNSMMREQGLERFNDTSPKALALTRALLQLLLSEIRADNAEPIVMAIPNKRTMATNLPFSDSEIKAMGASLLDGRSFLTEQDYYNRDSHWRASGHRKTAGRLAEMIDAEN
jgi:lysophospholipase L1-like esterase